MSKDGIKNANKDSPPQESNQVTTRTKKELSGCDGSNDMDEISFVGDSSEVKGVEASNGHAVVCGLFEQLDLNLLTDEEEKSESKKNTISNETTKKQNIGCEFVSKESDVNTQPNQVKKETSNEPLPIHQEENAADKSVSNVKKTRKRESYR